VPGQRCFSGPAQHLESERGEYLMPREVQGHQHAAARLDALVQEISEFTDPLARATAEELVQTLLDMYGEGLARLLEITAESKASGSRTDRYLRQR
jgi:hypothetical protein